MLSASFLSQYLRPQVLMGAVITLVLIYVGTFVVATSYYKHQIAGKIHKLCEAMPQDLACQGKPKFEVLYIDFHEPISGYGQTGQPYFFKFVLNREELSLQRVDFLPFNNNVLLYKRRNLID